jgi:hypothetical protein
MIVQIEFSYKRLTDKIDFSKVWELVYSYYHSGQVICDTGIVISKTRKSILFNGLISSSFALNSEFENRHVKKQKKEIIKLGATLKIKTVGIKNNPEKESYKLNPKTDYLVLSLDNDTSSPIELIRNGKIISYPLFLLPYLKNDDTFWNINSFLRLYRNTRKLYFDGLDDVYFENQLLNPKKFILKTAKKFCLQIEDLTGVTCFLITKLIWENIF